MQLKPDPLGDRVDVIDADSKQAHFIYRTPTIIGVFALFVWGHGIFYLWPLPPKSDLLPLDLQWALWLQTFILTFFGLVAAALAYRAIRFWWGVILITSGIFLFMNVPPLVSNIIDSPGFSHWLDTWIRVFGRFVDEGNAGIVVQTIYNMIVYPLYHIGLVTATLVYLAFKLRKSIHDRPTAALTGRGDR